MMVRIKILIIPHINIHSQYYIPKPFNDDVGCRCCSFSISLTVLRVVHNYMEINSIIYTLYIISTMYKHMKIYVISVCILET